MPSSCKSEFVHALSLLTDAEVEGALLAPSQEVGSLLLEHLDRSPHLTDHLSEENGEAALLLFSQFVNQRRDKHMLEGASRGTVLRAMADQLDDFVQRCSKPYMDVMVGSARLREFLLQ